MSKDSSFKAIIGETRAQLRSKNEEISYANRNIHGIRSVLVITLLLACFSFGLVPVLAYSVIVEVSHNSVPLLLAAFLFFAMILELGLLYLGLKIFFGKLYVVLDDSQIKIIEKIPGFKAKVKEINMSDASCIRMDCGASNTAAGTFRSNGHTQVFAPFPVSYNISINDTMQSMPVLSSGNYELVESLYQKLCSCYPDFKSIQDISKRDELLQKHKARVNQEKLKATRVLAIICAFASFLTALPLVSEYHASQSAKAWCKTSGVVTIPEEKHGEAPQAIITYSWQGKSYTQRCERNTINRRQVRQKNTGNAGNDDIVEIYVNPQNPGKYTWGPNGLSSLIGIMIAQAVLLSLFVVLLILSMKYRKIHMSFYRNIS